MRIQHVLIKPILAATLSMIISGCKKEASTLRYVPPPTIESPGDSLLSLAELNIQSGNLDSAEYLVKKAAPHFSHPTYRLISLKNGLSEINNVERMKQIYLQMDSIQVNNLERGKFRQKYFDDSIFDSLFITKMRALATKDWEIARNRNLKQEKENNLRQEIENGIAERISHANDLRERFLDNGFDIKVGTSGKEKRVLDLLFPLFNDVWTHRFKKDGFFETLSSKGFDKVNIMDGNDYHIKYDLKNMDEK